jgi:hypothetical protein
VGANHDVDVTVGHGGQRIAPRARGQ